METVALGLILVKNQSPAEVQSYLFGISGSKYLDRTVPDWRIYILQLGGEAKIPI